MKIKAVSMNQEKEKLEIIKWVRTLKDDSSIERLKMLRKSHTRLDWWTEIAEDEKSAIDKGLADIKAGQIKPHRDARKIYEKWL